MEGSFLPQKAPLIDGIRGAGNSFRHGLRRATSLCEGGFGSTQSFISSPEAPSMRQTPPVGGGGTKCQKGNSCRANARLKECFIYAKNLS